MNILHYFIRCLLIIKEINKQFYKPKLNAKISKKKKNLLLT